MLPTHGRYSYSALPSRRPYEWPNGCRLAVFVAVNVEQFPFGEGLGVDLAPRQPEPDVVNFGWRDWGNRVGVWRLLELFDALAIPATVLLNSAIYDHCPEVAAAFRARGDEFVGHGVSNAERQSDMDEAAERSMIAAASAALERHEGRRPAGWLGPWVSETRATPDLLQEAGYRYVLDWMADDQPHWLKTRSGRLLALPYARPTNDLPMLHGAKVPPALWADMLVDQFDEMLAQAERQPIVFNLSLHPYLVGHAFRLRHLRRALQHIAAHRDRIWLTRAGAIAEHAYALPPGCVP
jgi:peptidoglycan/xylan/chitin deacetylase (PgdA/CDA1 family)